MTLADWNSITRWDAATMRVISDDMAAQLNKLKGSEAELRDSATPEEWDGAGAEAAERSLIGIETGVLHRAEEFAALRAGLDDAAERLERLQHVISEVRKTATANHFEIDNGSVIAVPGAGDGVHPDMQGALQTRVDEIVRAGLDIDADLTTVILAIIDGQVWTGASTMAAAARTGAAAGESTMLMPPKDASPAETKAWWDTLGPKEREAMIDRHPERIGGLDGVPVVARDRANRALLQDKRTYLETRRDRLQAELDGLRGSADFGETGRRLREALAAIDGKLAGIGAIQDRLAHGDTAGNDADRYYLLDVQISGDGQAIVAKGNPDTADNVATFVPGTSQDLSKIGGHMVWSDRMQSAAERSNPDESTAVISYMGYDAPDSLVPDATQQSYAHGAKKDLDSFHDGLRATHEGSPANTTLVGHSYGSVVGAVAAHDENLSIDNLVMVGSPGGVYDRPGDIGVGQVYTTTIDRDPVNDQPFHGPDTDNDDDWASTRFESDAARNRGWPVDSAAHGEYWDPASKSLANMGHIIAGNPEKVTRP